MVSKPVSALRHFLKNKTFFKKQMSNQEIFFSFFLFSRVIGNRDLKKLFEYFSGSPA